MRQQDDEETDETRRNIESWRRSDGEAGMWTADARRARRENTLIGGVLPGNFARSPAVGSSVELAMPEQRKERGEGEAESSSSRNRTCEGPRPASLDPLGASSDEGFPVTRECPWGPKRGASKRLKLDKEEQEAREGRAENRARSCFFLPAQGIGKKTNAC